jgi:putative ABC transport system permease protein
MQKSIAAAVHTTDPQMALTEVRTMDQVRNEMFADDRFTMILFLCFAVVALLLASIGIYGVMAFSVALRTRDMAVRMALGATRSHVVALVLREGLTLVVIGFSIGLISAFLMARAMRSILYGTDAVDLPVVMAVLFTLLVVALLACAIPARRAASSNPMQALRTE